MTKTERKYLIGTLLGVVAIIGWNVFLIQRDDRMYKAYYHQQALTKVEQSTKIKE
jgi:predicted negative regulator of RcsB-dependent stress response